MACSGNILGSSIVLHSEHTLSDHLTSVGADDVDTKDLVGLLVSKDLDHTLALVVGTGTAVGHEGEHTLTVFDTGSLELFLGLSN